MALNVEGELSGGFAVKNDGAAALTAFEVHARFHGDDAWQLIASVAADYVLATSKKLMQIDASVSPITLAAGATSIFSMELDKVAEIKFEATCGTTTQLDISGIVK